ncbi:MAG: hypothetical protein V3V74_04655 [Nitrosomonadaceae bacterium]
MLYKCYVKNKVREVIVAQDMPIKSALDFLRDYKNGVVRDSSGSLYTREELLNVKSFGSKSRTRPDNPSTSGGKVSKGTNTELLKVTNGQAQQTDNT